MKLSLDQIRDQYDGSHYISSSEDIKYKRFLDRVVLTRSALTKNIVKSLVEFKLKKAISMHKSQRTARRVLHINRHKINNLYINSRIEEGLHLEGKKLDDDQVKAAVINEDITMVHAAAGSGKTLTLTAKVHDLLSTGVQPSDILVLSFTRKTVNDLSDRFKAAGISGVPVKTFHSLGRSIYRDSKQQKIKIADEAQSKKIIRQAMESLSANENYLRLLNDYLLAYHTMPQPITSLRSKAENILNNKAYSRKPLKSFSLDKNLLSAGGKTYKGEFVRSKEEQIIANFLFINNVTYVYEKPYPYGYPLYKPDFTLEGHQEPTYYEHFAIDKEGKAPSWFDKPHEYPRNMEMKRNRHKEYGTQLIETYSYEWLDGSLLKNLEARLIQADIQNQRMEEVTIHSLIKKHYGYDIEGFMTVLYIFMTLFKNRYTDTLGYERLVNEMNNGYHKTRTQAFFKLFNPIYDEYHKRLSDSDLQDFADLLLGAAQIVKNEISGDDHKYQYILVDEVQDISYARFELLKSLLDKTEGSKLFCVGDDFQSIYRFSGCDLSIMENIGEQLNREVRETSLKAIYRFGSNAALKTSKFIMANPSQYKKEIVAKGNVTTDIYLRSYVGDIDQTIESEKIIDICKEIADKFGQEKLEKQGVLVLGRYTSDEKSVGLIAEKLSNEESGGKSLYSCTGVDGIKFTMEFCTAHQSKGREHDFVIVIGCNNSYKGFPSRITSDPLLETLLAKPDSFKHAEERRLFYVATTRALLATYLVGSSSNLSEFVKELLPRNFKKNKFTCNVCGGKLVLRTGRNRFYGCENYIFGCNTTKNNVSEIDPKKEKITKENNSDTRMVDTDNRIYSKTGCGCYRHGDTWTLCEHHSRELGSKYHTQ